MDKDTNLLIEQYRSIIQEQTKIIDELKELLEIARNITSNNINPLNNIITLNKRFNDPSLGTNESHVAFKYDPEKPIKCKICDGFLVFRENAFADSSQPTGYINTIMCKKATLHSTLERSQNWFVNINNT